MGRKGEKKIVRDCNDFYIIDIYLMKKSFLRVEDWAPEINILDNPFWNNFLRSIDEF